MSHNLNWPTRKSQVIFYFSDFPSVCSFFVYNLCCSSAADEKKSKPKSKERSHSKTRKKERSHSRSRKSGSHEGGSDAAKASKTKDKIVAVENDVIKGAGIVNSGTQVIVKPADGPEIQIVRYMAVLILLILRRTVVKTITACF